MRELRTSGSEGGTGPRRPGRFTEGTDPKGLAPASGAMATAAEARIYLPLQHHVRRAGVDRPLFSPAAAELLFQHSQGLPRLVNRLATAALWEAAGRHAALVDADHVERAVAEWRDA